MYATGSLVRPPRRESFEPFNRALNLRLSGDLTEVQVSQVHTEGPYLFYQPNRNLEVVGLTVSDSFHRRHQELEAAGKLDHPLSTEEIEGLKQVRVVRGKWRGTGRRPASQWA
jgi:hypothetical protein